jgi:hypothetical protein
MRFLREALGKRRVVGVYDGDEMNLQLKIIRLVAADADGCPAQKARAASACVRDSRAAASACKASGVPCRKELFRIDTILFSSAKTCGQRHFKIDRAILYADMTVATAGRIGCCLIIYLHNNTPLSFTVSTVYRLKFILFMTNSHSRAKPDNKR